MSRTSAAPAASHPTPTPPPASEQRSVVPTSFRDALQLAAAQRDPKVAAARADAYERYGDDAERELAAFATRSHPLQRTCTAIQVEETVRAAAASFSQLPSKIGAS